MPMAYALFRLGHRAHAHMPTRARARRIQAIRRTPISAARTYRAGRDSEALARTTRLHTLAAQQSR